MAHQTDPLRARVERLERQVRLLAAAAIGGVVLTAAVLLAPRAQAQQTADSTRVRQLVVEDADGRARLVLGPLDAPGNTRRFGMRINDANGAERFGVAMMSDGRMVLGLDAPPGTGNDANRERITLAADEKGGAAIRFLDRRTNVVSRLYLDEQNRAWLSFSDFTQTPALIRRYGVSGEETLRLDQPAR
jgi:hypothetical protein